MIGYNIHEFAVVRAIKSYLEDKLEAKIPVFRGDDFNKITYPCIFVAPIECVEPDELTGTATDVVSVKVGVVTAQGVSVEKHEEYVAQLLDLIFNDDFVTELNAGRVDGLIVQQVKRPRRATSLDSDAGIRTTGQQLDLLCSMNG